jgi:uncharacterized membrane protein
VNTKSIIQVGIAFILLGIVAFSYQWTNDNGSENGVAIAPTHGQVEMKSAVPPSYIVGGLVMLGGIILVVVGVKKSPQ